jgi:WD40 repeat protein
MNQQQRELIYNMPYPLSGVLLEVFKLGERWESGETVPNLSFDICRATGLLLRMNAAVAIAAFSHGDRNIPELNSEVVTALRAPADGTWLNLTQRLLKGLKLDLPLFKALGQALNLKVEMPLIFIPGEEEPDSSAAGKKAQVKKVAVRDLLSQLIKFRNSVAHGERMTGRDNAEALAKLRAVVSGHEFYIDYRLIVRNGKRWLDCDGPGVQELGEGHYVPEWWTDPFRALLEDLPDGVVTMIKALPEFDSDDTLQLTPLLHFSQKGKEDVRFDDLFFVNRGTAEAAEYIAYNYEGQVSAEDIGSYEAFRELLQQLPTPPIPKEKRLEFDGLAEFHAQRFVGRRDVLGEIEEVLHQTEASYVELRALAGMGKTAIMSWFYGEYGTEAQLPWPGADKKPPLPMPADRDRWTFHFCMPTDGRDDPMVALQSIVCQLCDGAGLQRKQYQANEVEEQRQKLVQLLDKVAGQLENNARVFICIDALDEGIPPYGKDTVPNVLIGENEGEEEDAKSELPDSVVFLVSYRVDGMGVSRADEHLGHIPEEWRRRLDSADPLKGLTRDDVGLLLTRLAGEADVPEVPGTTLDATWKAATRDTGEKEGADPFYLRFLGDSVMEGDVDLLRPESIPADLSTVFEQTWLSLPSGSNYALHRILATLAILREYGTDELMQAVVNASLPAEEALRLTELSALRAKAGKLLVYDGERYGLFHDRFRWFLVGRPSTRLDMALCCYEEMDATGRFGPRQVAKLHSALADMAVQWNDSASPELVRDYVLQHGPHHQVMAGRVQDAVRTLTDYSVLNERLKSNRSGAWVKDMETVWQAESSCAVVDNPKTLQLWESYARELSHILERGDEYWPSNKIMLQLAVEHGDNSAVTKTAEAWLEEGNCDWLWLRNLRRPKKAAPDPCLRVLTGHEYGVTGACLLDEKRVLSWSDFETDLRIWDLDSGETLAVFGDAEEGIEGALVLADGSILIRHDILAVWDNDGEEIQGEFKEHKKTIVGAMELSDGRMLSWSWGKTLRIWDRQTCECLAVMKGHKEWVRGALELSSGNILSWSGDGTLRLWDTKTGDSLAIMEGHDPKAIDDYSTEIDSEFDRDIGETPGGVTKAVELSSGNILSWSGDDTFRIWKGDTGKPVCVLKHGDAEQNLSADAKELSDGRLLVLHSNSICLWDAANGELLKVLFEDELDENANEDEIDAFVPNGILALSDGNILSWDADSMRLWEGQSGQLLKDISSDFFINNAYELPDGKILTWPEEGSFTLWDLDRGQPLGDLKGHAGKISGLMSLQGGNILSWSEDTTLRLWNPRLAEDYEGLEGHRGGLSGVKFLPDGRVHSSGSDNVVRVWETETGVAITRLKLNSTRPVVCTLGNGHILATASGGEMAVWNSKTYELINQLSIDFGDDEEFVPFNSYGLVELQKGKVLSCGESELGGALLFFEDITDESCEEQDFIFETGSAESLSDISHHVFPDGRMLFSELEGKNLYIFNINFEELTHSLICLEGHSEDVEGMRVLSCGRILSWSHDGTLFLWDPDESQDLPEERIKSAYHEDYTFTRKKLSPQLKLEGHKRGTEKRQVEDAVEMANGNIASYGYEGTVRIWDKESAGQLAKFECGDDWTNGSLTPLKDGRLIFTGKNLCLCNPETGRLELELDYVEANRQRPELVAERFSFLADQGSLNFDDIKCGQWLAVDEWNNTFGVSHLGNPGSAFARWHGDSEGDLVKLHESGILTVSQNSGYVFALRLQKGNVPLTLSEADGLYKSS